MPDLVLVESHEKVGQAIELMQRYSISQIPVVRHEPADSLADVVGSIRERGLLERVFRNQGRSRTRSRPRWILPSRRSRVRESVDTVFADLSGDSAARPSSSPITGARRAS